MIFLKDYQTSEALNMDLYIMSGCDKTNVKHKQFKPIKNFFGKNKQ